MAYYVHICNKSTWPYVMYNNFTIYNVEYGVNTLKQNEANARSIKYLMCANTVYQSLKQIRQKTPSYSSEFE